MPAKHKKAVFALIAANLIWGAASPIFKWSLESIQPFTLAFLRFSLSSMIMLPFVYKNLYIAKKDILNIILLGFFSVFLSITFFFLGLEKTASINAPMIAASGPIILLILSHIILKERLKITTLTGTFISLIGIIIIIFQPVLISGMDGDFVGNLFFVVATFAGVFHTIIAKNLVKKYLPSTLTFWSFMVGAVFFMPFFLKENQTHMLLSELNFQGLTGILFGVLLCSTAAYCLFNWAVKNIAANETGIFTYIDPVVAVVIAIPLLGESITQLYLIGSVLVSLGIYITQGKINYHPIVFFLKKNYKKIDTLSQNLFQERNSSSVSSRGLTL